MKASKFKANDRVRILSNDLERQYRGKSGKVKKVYFSFSETGPDGHSSLYRVEVDGNVLKGVATDSDLELLK